MSHGIDRPFMIREWSYDVFVITGQDAVDLIEIASDR
jgi:hypothetical protein